MGKMKSWYMSLLDEIEQREGNTPDTSYWQKQQQEQQQDEVMQEFSEWAGHDDNE